jgi:NADH:ubiquinone oxidoreductase subunit 6 (subunit J)
MTRVLLLIMTALLAFGAADALSPSFAAAEPIPAQATARVSRGNVAKVAPHSDIVESKGKGMALLFWMFAAATVGGALFVITRRNLIAAVMGMVGSFLGISAIYMMLYASFLSVVQMLVYAGAIMVLFVFVVMILNRPEDEPVAPTGRTGQVLGGVAIVYLIGRLVMMLINVRAPNPATAIDAPAVPVESGLYCAPFQRPMPLMLTLPASVNTPPAYRSPLGASAIVYTSLFIAPPSATNADPFHFVMR